MQRRELGEKGKTNRGISLHCEKGEEEATDHWLLITLTRGIQPER